MAHAEKSFVTKEVLVPVVNLTLNMDEAELLYSILYGKIGGSGPQRDLCHKMWGALYQAHVKEVPLKVDPDLRAIYFRP